MLTAILTYDAPTATLLVLDTSFGASAYRLVRRTPGKADVVLTTVNASSSLGAGRTWKVSADGCPVLVLQGGTYTLPNEGAFVSTQEAAPVAFVLEAQHTEALAANYVKLGTADYICCPITNCRAILVRRDAGRSAAQKNNPAAADQLLTTTIFPS